MQKQTIARTLLKCYPRYALCIDWHGKYLHRYVEASFGVERNAEQVLEYVITRMVKKHQIELLKNRIDELVSGLPVNQSKLILSFFVEGIDPSDIAAKLEIHPRTLYKQVDKAIERISKRMWRLHINIPYFNDLISDHKWIHNEYIALTKKQGHNYVNT